MWQIVCRFLFLRVTVGANVRNGSAQVDFFRKNGGKCPAGKCPCQFFFKEGIILA